MLKNSSVHILFPQSCLNCKKEGSVICEDCLSSIEISEFKYCPFCKTPKRVFEKGTCSSHRKMRLSGIFSATSYKNPLVKRLISKFKYEPFLKNLGLPLASLIIAHFLLSENKTIFKDKENSVFVPIPLSRFRQRWRGFNQASLIARELSKFFKIPLLNNNLIKVKKTQLQVELKREEREKNIKGAFKVQRLKEIQGKRIFLIDDVFTTGATMEECARVLKKAGAKEVWGIVIARESLCN
ncbi:ComF family protein [Patescibacteria group bacterium]|nr:ComF family protein [Patescibacteria group bacterium]